MGADNVRIDDLTKKEKLEQLLGVNLSIETGPKGEVQFVMDEIDSTGRGNFAIGVQLGKALEEVHNRDKGWYTRNMSPEKVEGVVMLPVDGRAMLGSKNAILADKADGIIAILEKDPDHFKAVITKINTTGELSDRHRKSQIGQDGMDPEKIAAARKALDYNNDGKIDASDFTARKQKGNLISPDTLNVDGAMNYTFAKDDKGAERITKAEKVSDTELAAILGGREHRELIAAARSVISSTEPVAETATGTLVPGSPQGLSDSKSKGRSSP